VFQIMDWYCALFALMTILIVECIVIGWIYGNMIVLFSSFYIFN
jgi:hypothetical protein